MGLISPLGNTLGELWEALSSGRSGVERLSAIPPDHLPSPYGAEARQFTGDVGDFGSLDGNLKKAVRKGLKVMCRECQMGVAAAMRALADAGLAAGGLEPERSGIVFGSDYMLSEPQEFSSGMDLCAGPERRFDFSRWGGEGMRQMSPLWLLKYLPNMPACHIAIYHDLRGPNNSITHREASANLAVAEAVRTIQRGAADVMLAGATGTRVHVMKALHASQQEELAAPGSEPAQASRPFDQARTGMVLGEGAGVIVLEELEAARARGATIYAEVIGGGSSSVAARHTVAHRGRALENAARRALSEAGIPADQLGHIHAHGLSTRTSDREEAQALRAVLGEAADRIPLTAAKSYFGNLGAGSAAVELIASVLALRDGRLFPLLNYDTPDPDCPIFAARDGQTPAGESFLTLSVTPQGQASCVVVRRAE